MPSMVTAFIVHSSNIITIVSEVANVIDHLNTIDHHFVL